MSKKEQKKSVLSKQKPAKKKSTRFSKTKVLIYGSISFLMLASFVSFKWHLHKNPNSIEVFSKKVVETKSKLSLNPSKKVEFHFYRGKSELDDQTINEILKLAKEESANKKQFDLETIAKKIQTKLKLAYVHIIPVDLNKFVISSEKRKPYMKVQVGSNVKFTTKEGIIFSGNADILESGNFITLKGLLDDVNSKYLENPDNSLKISSAEQQSLLEAVELREKLIAKNHNIISLNFKEFRGFFVNLEKDNIEVVLGRAPFDKKLERLEKILKSQENIGQIASRIELDYDGKAFIKERKL